MSSWAQLFFLCLFVFCGSICASAISLIIGVALTPSGENISDFLATALSSVKFLWASQLATQICLFLIPTLLCAGLFHPNAGKFLKTNKIPQLKLLLAAIISIFTIQPIISFTSYYNSLMKLPESMAGIERWMQSYEQESQAVIEQMLLQPSISALLINLFIIAVMAGIVEEFLFRGALQQIFNRITSNYHVAIWISAFIFSAIHMQFYGFIPRMLLGALLGYTFVWSGNLWVPVIIHTLNNAMSVLLFRVYHGTPQYEQIETFGANDFLWLPISLILTGITFVYMHKEYKIRIFKTNDIE